MWINGSRKKVSVKMISQKLKYDNLTWEVNKDIIMISKEIREGKLNFHSILQCVTKKQTKWFSSQS